jgi:DNA-binding HxlR family transcriptional regulator
MFTMSYLKSISLATTSTHFEVRMRETLPSLGVETMIAVFGGKWRPLIMLHLIGGSRQFLELQRIIPGISQKVLTQHLKELVGEDIVFRKSSGQAPAPVSYGLTPYGETVIPISDAMCKWGHDHHRRHPRKRRRVTAQI